MKSTSTQKENTQTAFVHLNSYACTACWKCIDACPEKVIDKSFLYAGETVIHEQVLLYNANACTGCMQCIQACQFDAINVNK